MNIIIAAGGTGGHIYPAIAIMNKFIEKEKANILYIGTHNRMEKDLIPKLGIRYEELEIYGFSKTLIKRDIKNLFLIKKAIKKCEKIIQEFKPDVVIGAGGYVTMPVIYAAKKLGIKTAIHEQNSIPGKTNKYLCKNVDLVMTSYENSNHFFKKAKKVVYTGNPSGENALVAKKITKNSLGLSEKKKLVLVVSGSLGSLTVNNFFLKLLSMLTGDEEFEILYITGKDYYEDFTKDKSFAPNIKILPYLDNLSGLFSSTDLIISRAGASTISEILACSVPSILIPSPYVAGNHQYYNALDLKEKGLSILLEEKDLNAEKLYKDICNLTKENEEYQKMKDNLKHLNMKGAGEIIYEEIKKVI